MLKNKSLLVLTECAIMVALATVLSLLKIYDAPFGGSVTALSMVPIILVSFRRGVKVGLGAAFVYSVIQLILGLNNFAHVATPVGIISAVLFDYIVPFTLLGLAGAFQKDTYSKENAIYSIISGVFLVCILRFISHFIVGSVIWYEITKELQWNDYVNNYGAWMYSFIYNITYMGPETAITLLATPLIYKLKDL